MKIIVGPINKISEVRNLSWIYWKRMVTRFENYTSFSEILTNQNVPQLLKSVADGVSFSFLNNSLQ